MRLDLDQQLKFSCEITTASLWTDIVLWSIFARTVVELAVPWEEAMEAAFERKKEKCSNKYRLEDNYLPVEVSCGGFIVKSTQRLLRGSQNEWGQDAEGPQGTG